MVLQAIAVDSNFVHGNCASFNAYGNQGIYEEAKKWCLRAYEKRDMLTAFQKIDRMALCIYIFETPHERIKCLKQSWNLMINGQFIIII